MKTRTDHYRMLPIILWLASPAQPLRAQPDPLTYKLQSIEWKRRVNGQYELLGTGKQLTFPNLQGRGEVTVTLNLPDVIRTDQGFNSYFALTTTNAPTPWDIRLNGWGPLDTDWGFLDSCVYGEANPVNISMSGVWKPVYDVDRDSWNYTVEVTAAPHFRDQSLTKTYPLMSAPPNYPYFSMNLAVNGGYYIAAFVNWAVQPPPPDMPQIDQKIAARETSMKITVHGRNFSAGTMPALLLTNGVEDADSVISNVQIGSSTLLEARLYVMPEAVLGPRILRVRSAGQDNFKTNALNVVSIGLEINQGAKTSLAADRVANHPTVVRVHLGSTRRIPTLTGGLCIFNGGTQIAGSPFYPSAPNMKFDEAGRELAMDYLSVKTNYTAEDRFFLRDTLNFHFGNNLTYTTRQLPAGDYNFMVAINPADPAANPGYLSGLTKEAIMARKDLILYEETLTQNFKTTKPLRVLALVDYRLRPPMANAVMRSLQNAQSFFEAAYPVDGTQVRLTPDRNFNAQVFDINALKPSQYNPFSHWWASIHAQLASCLAARNRLAAADNQYDRIALVTDMVSVSELAEDAGTKGITDLGTGAIITGDNLTTFAHELGHTYQLGDTYPKGWTTPANPRRADAVAEGNLVEDGALRLMPIYSLRGRPLIPVTASVAASGGPPPNWGTKTRYQRLSLMGGANDDNVRWFDQAEWSYLLRQFKISAAKPQSTMGVQTSSGDFLTVGGVIDTADNLAGMEAARDPNGAAWLPAETGPFEIELLSAGGVVLASRSFGVAFNGPAIGATTAISFKVSIPMTAGAAKVQLRKAAKVLFSQAVSAHPPAVTVQSPGNGELVGGLVDIRWTATDPDGDPLAFSVYYLRDGVNPALIARNLTTHSFRWDSAMAAGGNQARIAVAASDGINEGQGISPAFNLAKKGPTVAIYTPANGIAVPSGGVLFLGGSGFDPEDGYLPGSALSFRSDRDVNWTPTGESVEAYLSEGRHTITLRGVDKDGNSGETQITVIVGAKDEVPVLESLAPDRGAPGTAVTLTGRNFAATNTVVRFGTNRAPASSLTATQCVAQVPAGLPAGEVAVSVAKGDYLAEPLPFTVLVDGGSTNKVALVSLSPTQAAPGAKITIQGQGFSPVLADNLVNFGTAGAAPVSATATILEVLVPAGLPPGLVQIRVTVNGMASDPAPFMVLGAPGPALSAAPVALDFGLVAAGQTKDLTVTITNSGTAALAVNSLGIDNPHFSVISPATPFPVNPGVAILITIRFNPGSSQAQGGTLTIRSNDPNQPAFGVGLAGSGFAVNQVNLPYGLLGWWPGEGQGTDLAGAHHGVLKNGAGFAPGRVGQAFSFNGADGYVEAGAWSPGSAWTVEAWVNPSAIASGRKGLAGAFYDCHDWGLVLQDGVFALSIRPAGGCAQSLSSGASAATNTWYHLAGACDGTTATLYVNGQLKNSGPVEMGYPGTSAGVRIGGEVCCGGDNFAGLIDEVAIYNRALSPAEVAAIFNAGSQGKNQAALAGPRLELDRETLDFGGVLMGQNQELTLAVHNPGNTPLTISSLSSDNSRFAVVLPLPPITVNPMEAAQIKIRYNPGAAATETGTLNLASNDPNRPTFVVFMTGQGAPASLSGALMGTLSVSNSPYLATGDLYIPGNQTLAIEPGVVVQFQNAGAGLTVDGTLVARGTVEKPIVFTSDKTIKHPGQWRSIYFRDGSVDTNTILENCVMEYGGAAGAADEIIRVESASPTITNCVIRGSRLSGINFLASDARVENCVFRDNGGYAMSMRIDAFPRLRNNLASNNGQDAIGVWDNWTSRSGTWVKDTLPYTLVNYIGVSGGHTLTIEPGVVVQGSRPDAYLLIDGCLVAKGSTNNPIVFTSDKTVKSPGQWGAIIFRQSNLASNSILENCVVEYGGASGVANENIRFENASPTVRQSLIRGSRANGLACYNSDPKIEGCRFAGNGGFAMAMRIDSYPLLRNNTASGNGQDAIGVGDNWTSRPGTWVKDNLPYTLVNYVGVSGGHTLTIEPGVVVQGSRPDAYLLIDGCLVAKGSTNNPIVFTSDKTVKSPGQWGAIIFRQSNLASNSILENCVVEYGGAAGVANENIRFENASPTVRQSLIRGSRANGLACYNSDPKIEGCRFAGNGGFAMAMRIDSYPLLRNNTASGNGQDAIGVGDNWTSHSGTWVKDNLPYTLANYIGVSGGHTLTIEPGVVVQGSRPDVYLLIDGCLVAKGGVDNPVIFTSDKLAKGPGQWGAIIFRQSNLGTNSILENCVVECGGASGVANENIRFENASPTVRRSLIRGSRANGMTFHNSDPTIESCRFVGNREFALYMKIDSFPRFLGNSAEDNGRDAIGVWENWTTRSGVWVKDNLPYILVNTIGVSQGTKLTLEPGLVVQFQNPDAPLLVDGSLVANGTQAQPIRFTSDPLNRQPGQWQQICFRNAAGDADSLLNYCVIEYGGRGAEGSLTFYGASPRVTNTTIRQSASDGIHAQGGSPRIANARLLDNGRDGLRAVSGANPVLSNSIIAGNSGLGINNLDASRVLSAKNNYWGHASGPYDNANTDGLGLTNPSGLGQKVSEYADWGQFLKTDPTTPPQFPMLVIDPASLAFGKIAPGGNASLTLTVSNAGNAALTVSAITSGNSQFSVLATLPFKVPAGASQPVAVRFTPSMEGSQSAFLAVQSDDPSHASVKVPLSGAAGSAAGLLGEFFQFNRSLGIMPNMNGVRADCTAVFASLKFPLTSQAFTNADGLVLRAGQTNVLRENFSARFTGSLNVAAPGDYIFTLASDDGAILKVNGEDVLDQNYAGAYRTIFGAMHLAAGSFPIELDYFQQGGAAGLELGISGSGPVTLTTNAAPTRIELAVESGYSASTFAERIGLPIGLVFSSRGTYGERLLVSDGAASGGFGALLAFGANGLPVPLSDAVSAATAMVIDPGTAYGGGLLVADDFVYGRDLPSPGNRDIGSDRLKRVMPDGTANEFATLYGANGLAWGQGALGFELLVSDSYAQKIFRVNPAGQASDFASGRGFSGLAASEGGAFGNALYVGDWNGNCILAATSNGVFSLLASNIPSPISLAIDTGGGLGGDLFVSSFAPDVPGGAVSTKPSGAIYRVKAGGQTSLFASGLRFRTAFSGDLAFGFKGDLFVLEDGRGRILRFSPGQPQVSELAVAPDNLDFGAVPLGQSKDLNLTVRNSGSAPLVIYSLTITNERFSVISPATPFNIGPANTSLIAIRFTPAGSGLQAATLALDSNDPIHPKLAIALAGSGATPGIDTNLLAAFAIQRLGAGQFALTWPAGLTNIVVEAADSLNVPIAWVSAASPPVLAGDRWVWTVAPASARQFFRLRWRP